MLPLSRWRGRSPIPPALGLAALILGVCGGAARADFVINGTFSSISSGFLYKISVTNNGPDDLLLVSLFQTGLLTTVTPTGAPSGFTLGSSSDGATTFVDLAPALGSPSTFAAGSTVGTFRFSTSTFLGATPELSALDVNGGAPAGTVGSLIQVAAPEPGSLSLAAPGLLAALALRNRRRRVVFPTRP
jgi:hypothetical protein